MTTTQSVFYYLGVFACAVICTSLLLLFIRYVLPPIVHGIRRAWRYIDRKTGFFYWREYRHKYKHFVTDGKPFASYVQGKDIWQWELRYKSMHPLRDKTFAIILDAVKKDAALYEEYLYHKDTQTQQILKDLENQIKAKEGDTNA